MINKSKKILNLIWEGADKMKEVMEVLKKFDAVRQIPVLRLEIDYELMVLSEALQAKNSSLIKKTKERLYYLTNELQKLEG